MWEKKKIYFLNQNPFFIRISVWFPEDHSKTKILFYFDWHLIDVLFLGTQILATPETT